MSRHCVIVNMIDYKNNLIYRLNMCISDLKCNMIFRKEVLDLLQALLYCYI